MKLLIDIPENLYQEIMDNADEIQENGCVFDRAIINGTPIPDNAKNGDVIKAFYPQLVVGSNNLGKTIFLRPNANVVIEDRMSDWWNAPYQKGGKE